MNSYRRQRLIEISKSLQNLRTGRNLHFSYILNKNQLFITGVNSYDKLHPYHKFGHYTALKETWTKEYGKGRLVVCSATCAKSEGQLLKYNTFKDEHE